MEKRKSRKSKVGTVVSASMEKTAVVKVITKVMHPRYRKYVKSSKKYYAHDENNECSVGDIVRISETRPLSKSKRWRLVDINKSTK